MIHKTKLFEWIEDYCLNNLDKPERIEFEEEFTNNRELQEEVRFEKEMQAAVTEKDVLSLREKLENAAKSNTDKPSEASFNLFEDFTDIRELTSNISPEELLDYYDALPKVHIYHHDHYSKENIHEFYREQNPEKIDEDEEFMDFSDVEMEGLDEALLEKDVMDLRSTLNGVARSVQVPFSSEEIDRYIRDELEEAEKSEFEKELGKNGLLQREVMIHRELEKSLGELDVVSLREKISQVMTSETSWNVSEKDIEDYLAGELEGRSLEDFTDELSGNLDLKAEVTLRKEVEQSVGEKDIMRLREKLRLTKDEVESKEMKSIVPDTKVHQMQWWKTGVAVAIVLFAFMGLFRDEFSSPALVYEQYYQSPQWSPQRSVTPHSEYLQKANTFYVNGEFSKAIDLYDQALERSTEKYVFRFFKAASLQNLERYEDAAREYSRVIDQGDNMFIEEAQWNRSLCYLKSGSEEKARDELMAIIERKGYYAQDAKAILRRLRFSLK